MKNVYWSLATIALLAGLVCIFLGQGFLGTCLLVGGGIAIGLLMDPSGPDSADIEGASGSTD
jgi:hypothetical protein